MKAIWKGTVIAESDDTVLVEGDHYFPTAAVKQQYLLASNTRRMSGKGEATFFTLFVDGDAHPDGAWTHADPKEEVAAIRGRIAFGRGVQVVP
ncbi:MAG: DUF427 domain-containing protein [Rubrivivax sp.]